jgi:carbon-monoxide dehydrogenase small subunit
MTLEFFLNGDEITIETKPANSLLFLLRKIGNLHGTRGICQGGYCGKCLVLKDGFVEAACTIAAFALNGSEIVTIEEFCKSDEYKDIEKGFLASGINPCSLCAQSKVFIAHHCLQYTSNPDDATLANFVRASRCNCTSDSIFIKCIRFAAEFRRRRNARK